MKCGTPLSPDATICDRCGTPRSVSPGPEAQPPPGAPAYVPPPPPSSTPWGPSETVVSNQFPPLPPGSYGQPTPPGGQYAGGQPPPGAWPPGSAPGPPPKGRKGKLGALVVVAGLLAASVVGVLVYRGVTGSGGGAKSPEAAVQRLADAVSNEDPVAAIAALDPDEVRSLGELYESTETKAGKLGLTGEKKTFAGIDLRVEDLEYTVDELSDDLAKVTFSRGTLHYDVKVKDLPDRVQSAAENELEDESGTVDQRDLQHTREGQNTRRDPFLIVTKRSGGWYISPFLTLGEYAIDINGEPAGDFEGERKEELTAKTPEDAVRHLSDAIESTDPDRVIDALADDTRVLRVYRKAITDAVRSELTDCRGSDCDVQDLELSIDGLELDAAELRDNQSKVTIKGVTGDIKYTDGDGESVDESFEFDGRCIITNNQDDDDDTCLNATTRRFGVEEAFLVAVKEDGRWAVSPMETMLEYGRSLLASIDDNLLRRFTSSMHEVENAAPVEVDEHFDARLNDAGWATYELKLDEGQTISIDVDDGDIEGYADAALFDPDGDEIDSFGTTVTAPADGTYRLVVVSDSFEKASLPVTLAEVPEEQIEVGTEVEVSLDSDTPVHDFLFEGESGDAVSVIVDDTSLEVRMLDPDGTTIYSDDDVYQLNSSGTYRVRLRTYSDEPADHTLLVVPPPPFLLDGEATSAVEGSLSDSFDIEYYSIEVRSGSQLTVTVTPDALLDAMITIYDPDNDKSEENSGGPGVAEVFDLSADSSGTWYLEVGTPADVSGDFTLEVVEVD